MTSYDYASPVDEQGRPTAAYHALRKQLASYLPAGETLPDVPAPIPTMTLPEIKLDYWTSVWDHMPRPIETEQPATFESLGQNQGLMVYRTKLPAGAKGTLSFGRVSDYAQVLVDGKAVGTLDRSQGQRTRTRQLGRRGLRLGRAGRRHGPHQFQHRDGTRPQRDFGRRETRRRGADALADVPLSARRTVGDGVVQEPRAGHPPGVLSSGYLSALDAVADTFVDTSKYSKGMVWVNGHNLGRYWQIGPQQRLYCPASWLRKGDNDIVSCSNFIEYCMDRGTGQRVQALEIGLLLVALVPLSVQDALGRLQQR